MVNEGRKAKGGGRECDVGAGYRRGQRGSTGTAALKRVRLVAALNAVATCIGSAEAGGLYLRAGAGFDRPAHETDQYRRVGGQPSSAARLKAVGRLGCPSHLSEPRICQEIGVAVGRLEPSQLGAFLDSGDELTPRKSLLDTPLMESAEWQCVPRPQLERRAHVEHHSRCCLGCW